MDEQFHWESLFTYDVDYGCLESDLVPQGDNTSFASPFAAPG